MSLPLKFNSYIFEHRDDSDVYQITMKLQINSKRAISIVTNTRNKNICSKGVRIVVFNTLFNTISVISWLSFLLVEKIGVPGANP